MPFSVGGSNGREKRSPSVEEILTSSGVAVKKRFDGGVGDGAFRAVSYRDSGVESVVVALRSGAGGGVGAVVLRLATKRPSSPI